MGKSSSSSKKIKRSSKLRSVKKKKKIRRIKDYSDESDSTASLYSSSDDDYTRRKRRSKLSSKKRSRKRYSSSESDDDDDTRLLKKRKRSKRKDKHVGKNKSKGSSRKRRKRDSSSTSHGSESDNVKAAPSRSKDSEPDEHDDRGVTNNNPARLKSIIVVSSNYGNDDTKDYSGNRELRDSEDSDERDGDTSKASHHPDISLEDDDLEATLKKRALENLKRFRTETQRSGMPRKEESSSPPLQTDTELVEEQKPCASPVSKDSETSLKILKAVNAMECETSLANLATHQSADTAKLKSSSGTTKRKLVRPVLVQESLNLASREEAAGCLDVEAETINDGCTIETVSPQNSLALATKNGGENIESTNISSTLNTESSSHADSETLDEAIGKSHTADGTKDESQYEQKTMTVMRGGELVQVNYKVYIPKKTSSLGRRKLKR